MACAPKGQESLAQGLFPWVTSLTLARRGVLAFGRPLAPVQTSTAIGRFILQQNKLAPIGVETLD